MAAILANPRYTGRQVWNRQRTSRPQVVEMAGGPIASTVHALAALRFSRSPAGTEPDYSPAPMGSVAFVEDEIAFGGDKNGGLSMCTALRTLAVDRVTAEVIPALGNAQIPAILLKGPSIARWLYPAGGRSYVDTDVLVPATEMTRAQQVLQAHGFTESLKGFHPAERDANPVESQFIRQRVGQQVTTEKVDLHRNLPYMPAADPMLWDTFEAYSELMPIGGIQVRVLGRPALALHIALHAVQHRFTCHTGEDLARALAALPADGWRTATSLAARLGATELLATGLRQYPRGTAVADQLGLPHPRNPFWLSAPRGAESLASLRPLHDTQAALRWMRWTLLPSPAKIRYVTRSAGSPRETLAGGYVRWWAGLARSALCLARYAARGLPGSAGRARTG